MRVTCLLSCSCIICCCCIACILRLFTVLVINLQRGVVSQGPEDIQPSAQSGPIQC